MDIEYNKLSNSELKIILVEMENEYESLKTKIKQSLERMETLDKKYNDVKKTLDKRTKGKIWRIIL